MNRKRAKKIKKLSRTIENVNANHYRKMKKAYVRGGEEAMSDYAAKQK